MPVSVIGFEHQAFTNSDRVTVDKPAGVSAGDLLVAAYIDDLGFALVAEPGGTIAPVDWNGGGVNTRGFAWKVASASEPADYEFIFPLTAAAIANGAATKGNGHVAIVALTGATDSTQAYPAVEATIISNPPSFTTAHFDNVPLPALDLVTNASAFVMFAGVVMAEVPPWDFIAQPEVWTSLTTTGSLVITEHLDAGSPVGLAVWSAPHAPGSLVTDLLSTAASGIVVNPASPGTTQAFVHFSLITIAESAGGWYLGSVTF